MNYTSNRALPFEIEDVSHGLQKVEGLLRTTEEGLELEFEVADNFIGFFKSGVKKMTLHFKDLEDIIFKKGWFSSKIILNGTSMKVFEDIPGSEVATLKLKIKRKNREEAEKLISRARLRLSEFRLDQMGGD